MLLYACYCCWLVVLCCCGLHTMVARHWTRQWRCMETRLHNRTVTTVCLCLRAWTICFNVCVLSSNDAVQCPFVITVIWQKPEVGSNCWELGKLITHCHKFYLFVRSRRLQEKSRLMHYFYSFLLVCNVFYRIFNIFWITLIYYFFLFDFTN